jgi:FkbM family methyltransferase
VGSLVNTRQLFLALLRDLRVDKVCDVGSMDGRDALAFRARLPGATVLALEPHPDNLARMCADVRLRRARIRVVAAAASDREGRSSFHLVDADPGDEPQARARRGMSSLHRRDTGITTTKQVDVATITLDGLLRDGGARIGLWIDVEGHAYQVIEGMRRIAARVQLIHVELESQPCIASGQYLAGDVDRLLRELGFEELATDQPRSSPQFNAVYLRRGQPALLARRVAWQLWRARWRRRFVLALRQGCPGCFRRLAAWHLRVAR